MAAGPPVGWQQLNCKWTDASTGETGESLAHPHWLGWPNHLVFTFDGRPTDMRISGDNGSLRVEMVEWLVKPSQ